MKPLKIVQNDSLLEPYSDALQGRYDYALRKEKELVGNNANLSEFATGYLFFGLHKVKRNWFFREWAPNATAIYIIGDFNDWKKSEDYRLQPLENGVWEGRLGNMAHGDLYKLLIEWNGGYGERIPAWARRVVQDEHTKIFSAQVWSPEEEYKFKIKKFKPSTSPLLIYECHIGMATEEEKVGTYDEFRRNVLPRVIEAGYNACNNGDKKSH